MIAHALSARAVGSIPFVRVQIARLRRGGAHIATSDVAQAVAAAVAAAAVAVDRRVAAGMAGLLVFTTVQMVWVRRPLIAAKVLGMRQMVLGIALVAVTATGSW